MDPKINHAESFAARVNRLDTSNKIARANSINSSSKMISDPDTRSAFNNSIYNQKNETSTDGMTPLKFREKYKKQFIFGHLNVNSFRWKFYEASNELLSNHVMDLAFFSESKLDSSFPPGQFSVPGFRDPPFRADRNKHGGGLIAYIRSDIPNRRRYDIERLFYDRIEVIALEITLRNEKWLFVGFYKPPDIQNDCLIKSFENVLNTNRSEFVCVSF